MIKLAVELAKAEGFPSSVEEKEAFFLDQVSKGEALGTDRKLRRDEKEENMVLWITHANTAQPRNPSSRPCTSTRRSRCTRRPAT